MEKIGFSSLEDRIIENCQSEQELNQYEYISKMSSQTVNNSGEVLRFALAISDIYNQNGFEDSYFHIGGYGVLFHIINSIGIDGIWNWRGSHDLDIVTTNYGASNLLIPYFDVEVFNSKSLKSKEKLEVRDPQTSSSVEVDLYVPENGVININGNLVEQRLLDEIQKIRVLGIDVNVPKIHDLLALKLSIECSNSGLPRGKDLGDILNLLGCLENNEGFNRKYPSTQDKFGYLQDKLDRLNPNYTNKLKSIIENLGIGTNREVLVPPSNRFKNIILNYEV